MKRAWQWLAAAGAVALGAWSAFQQWPSIPETPASRPVVEQTPAPGPSPAAGHEPAPAPAILAPGADPAAATNAPAAGRSDSGEAEPGSTPVAPPPDGQTAKLPAFFRTALGTPPAVAIEDLEEGSPQALQARLEREPRDEAWASRVEWHLENYLALREHVEVLGSPSVRCGSTVCRVMASTDKARLAAAPDADWHEMMSHLRYESVSNEFSGAAEMIVFNATEPDRVGFVTYLSRAGLEE